MNRPYRSFLLGAAALALVGAAAAQDANEDLQNRLRAAYRQGYRRARAQGLEQIRDLSDSRVRLARRLLTAQRLHEAMAAELAEARQALAACGEVSIPRGEMPAPGDMARLPTDLPTDPASDAYGELPSAGTGGPFGLPGPTIVATPGERPVVVVPLGPDPRVVEAGARGVVAGVQRDVNVVGTAAQEGVGVVGTMLRENGEMLQTGVGAVGTVAGGYVEAVQGLGEERTLLEHAGHTVTSIGGGWVQAGQDVGGQLVEGHQQVWGRAWDGAQEVGGAWWDGTRHLANEVLSPFRSEDTPESD